jgi:hypothetical protein
MHYGSLRLSRKTGMKKQYPCAMDNTNALQKNTVEVQRVKSTSREGLVARDHHLYVMPQPNKQTFMHGWLN